MAFEDFACFAIVVLTVCAVFAIIQQGLLAVFKSGRVDVFMCSVVRIVFLYAFTLAWLGLVDWVINYGK